MKTLLFQFDGQFRFTKDPISMGKLDYTKFQTPQIKNETSYEKAERFPHPFMDKITINQNVFIEVQDKNASGSGSDITIIPVEINLEFLARHRVGPKMKYGTT